MPGFVHRRRRNGHIPFNAWSEGYRGFIVPMKWSVSRSLMHIVEKAYKRKEEDVQELKASFWLCKGGKFFLDFQA